MVSATSRDVAKRAGVSTATVSRVLNDFPHVSPTVRRRVRRAVEELKYQPNRTAQRLRAKQSRVIGLIISDIQNPFFTAIVRGIEDIAYQHGYSLVLCNSDEQPAKEHLYINVMRAEAVAGIIIASTLESNPHISELREHNIPVVAVDRRVKNKKIDSASVSNERGTFAAVSHLIELGHRKIGFIGLPAKSQPGKERYAGYQRALSRNGLPRSRQLIRIGDAKQLGGHDATLGLLKSQSSITALFVANNLMTLGALQAIRELGLKIPDDISVVGFDDAPWSTLLEPPLTVVAQPTYELGAKAAELLLDRVQDPVKPTTHIQLPTTLIVRGSTSKPRAQTHVRLPISTPN